MTSFDPTDVAPCHVAFVGQTLLGPASGLPQLYEANTEQPQHIFVGDHITHLGDARNPYLMSPRSISTPSMRDNSLSALANRPVPTKQTQGGDR